MALHDHQQVKTSLPPFVFFCVCAFYVFCYVWSFLEACEGGQTLTWKYRGKVKAVELDEGSNRGSGDADHYVLHYGKGLFPS